MPTFKKFQLYSSVFRSSSMFSLSKALLEKVILLEINMFSSVKIALAFFSRVFPLFGAVERGNSRSQIGITL